MRLPSLRESAPLRLVLIISVIGVADVFALMTPKPTVWAVIIPCLVPVLSGIFVIPLAVRNARKK